MRNKHSCLFYIYIFNQKITITSWFIVFILLYQGLYETTKNNTNILLITNTNYLSIVSIFSNSKFILTFPIMFLLVRHPVQQQTHNYITFS